MIADLQRQLGIDSSFFFQFVIFIAIYLWLQFIYFGPFLKLITKREAQSEGMAEEAKKLDEQSARLESEHQEKIAAARKQAAIEREKILAEARKSAAAVVATARDQAKAKLEGAREASASEAKKDLDGLRAQISPFASLLVEKLMKTKVGL